MKKRYINADEKIYIYINADKKYICKWWWKIYRNAVEKKYINADRNM